MNVAILVALAVAIPVVLFPVALVWYINIGGMVEALRAAKARKAVAKTVA